MQLRTGLRRVVSQLPNWGALRTVAVRERCLIARAVDTTAPLETAVRFLRRGRPVKPTANKAWEYQYSAEGRKCVVGGPMLKGTGAYPSQFGTKMAQLAVFLSKGRGL